MKSFRYLTALGLSLSLLSVSSADAVLISVKSLGMAGIGYGYAQDAMAAAHNPGSAAAVESRFDAGLIYSHLKGDIEFAGNNFPGPGGSFDGSYNGYHSMKNFFAPTFGINYNVDCNLTVGLVVYNRDLAKTTYKNPFVLLGTSSAGLEYVHQTASPYIAYRWGCHNFGVSLNWDIQRAKVNGFQNFDKPETSVSVGNVTNKGYNWSNGIGWTFGYYVHLTDTLNFGVSYQPETQMSRFKKYKGFLAAGGKFNIPEKWGVGFSWRFIDCATFAFDYEYVHWTQVRGVKNKLLNPEGGTNQLGSLNGPGFGWTDKHYFRFGMDYAWSDCLTLRAGYRYAPTQIKKSQTVLNGFTLEPLVEHILTAGATYYLNCQDEIDFFGAYGFHKKLNGRGSVPATIGPNAPPSFPVPTGGGEANIDQDIIAIGISWGHKF